VLTLVWGILPSSMGTKQRTRVTRGLKTKKTRVTTAKKRVAKKATAPKRVTKKTTRAKATTKTTRRPKNTSTQSVREARYGGHKNTIPTNSKAPARLLGRSVTLAITFMNTPLPGDAIVVVCARLTGFVSIVAGLAIVARTYQHNILSLPIFSASVATSQLSNQASSGGGLAVLMPMADTSAAVAANGWYLVTAATLFAIAAVLFVFGSYVEKRWQMLPARQKKR